MIKITKKRPKNGRFKKDFAAHNPHNPKVGGSSPSSATKYKIYPSLAPKNQNFELKKIVYEL